MCIFLDDNSHVSPTTDDRARGFVKKKKEGLAKFYLWWHGLVSCVNVIFSCTNVISHVVSSFAVTYGIISFLESFLNPKESGTPGPRPSQWKHT